MSPNLLSDAPLSRPVPRITGGHFLVRVVCTKKWLEQGEATDRDLKELQSGGPRDSICTLQVIRHEETWSFREESHVSVDGSRVGLHPNSIYVTSSCVSVFSYLNGVRMILNLASMAVMMAIPRQIMTLVIFYGLGKLSQIYRRAVRKPFVLRDDLISIMMRGVVSDVVFAMLEREADMLGHVSREVVQQRVRAILESYGMEATSQEFRTVSGFIYDELQGVSSRH